MTELDPLLRIAVDTGCFLRREALGLGLDDKWLARGVRHRTIVRVRQGCYVPSALWETATPDERLVIRTRAVMRVANGPVAASHNSSCGLQGIALWGVDFDHAHVTRLDGGAGRVDRDATHHEGLWTDDDLLDVNGLAVIRAGRAVLETAALAGVESGLVAADSALDKKLATRQELDRYAQLMRHWPHAHGLRLVAALADGRSGSVGESRSRHMMWVHGLPRPKLQYKVYDGDELVGICDFCWPEHRLLGEFDGRVKYGRLLKPGQEPGEVVFLEKIREDRLREVTGFGMARWTWGELATPRDTCERIRRAFGRADVRRGA